VTALLCFDASFPPSFAFRDELPEDFLCWMDVVWRGQEGIGSALPLSCCRLRGAGESADLSQGRDSAAIVAWWRSSLSRLAVMDLLSLCRRFSLYAFSDTG
jgi:hypothetical protein